MRLRGDSIAKLPRVMKAEVVPLLCKQAEFIDQVTLISPERAGAIVITFWDKKESEEAFNCTRNPEVLRSLLEVIDGTPEVTLFEAADSTFVRKPGTNG